MNLAVALDFLLWQGHGPRAWDYTLRQINLFVETANERIKNMYGQCDGTTGSGTPKLY